MQYILSEKEYNDIQQTIKKVKSESLEIIEKLCREVANHKPVTFWSNKEPKIWGCIKDTASYCDECPVQDECPYEDKAWSK